LLAAYFFCGSIIITAIPFSAAFSQEYGQNFMLLKEYNPWLRDTKLTVRAGKSYEIAIPKKEDLYFDGNTIKIHDERWLKPN